MSDTDDDDDSLRAALCALCITVSDDDERHVDGYTALHSTPFFAIPRDSHFCRRLEASGLLLIPNRTERRSVATRCLLDAGVTHWLVDSILTMAGLDQLVFPRELLCDDTMLLVHRLDFMRTQRELNAEFSVVSNDEYDNLLQCASNQRYA